MEKKKFRIDDGVESQLRKFMSVISSIGNFLVMASVIIGFICGIAVTIVSVSDTIWPLLLCLLLSGIVAVIIWILMKLIVLVLQYFTDVHFYSRMQMEVALEAEGIELVDSESWVCPNCGKVHGMDAAFCGQCGTQKP